MALDGEWQARGINHIGNAAAAFEFLGIGGVSHSKHFVDYITERVGWIAPIKVYAGDFEMDALASGAIRALDGEEAVMTFTGEPSWKGFQMEGAIPEA